jgi:hypothetical protein
MVNQMTILKTTQIKRKSTSLNLIIRPQASEKKIQNGMVQAWVAHFVTPLNCTYNEHD